MKKYRLMAILILTLCACLFLVSCSSDDDDDDSGGSFSDDDDTIADDDDNDDNDDNDDDNDDDDDDNDNDDDDDTTPDDPYEGMAPAGKTLSSILGISSHMSRGTAYSWKREFEIDKLVESGMTMMRNDFHWYTIEPEDDVWNFAGLDTMVDLNVAAGLEITAIFLGSPDWATPGGTHDEIDPVEYADYAGEVAGHFADRIDYYEVWNEQNTTRFWKPEPNPEKYGDILKAAYTAVHANDPTATVIFGGLSPFETHFFHPKGAWNFLYRTWEAHDDLCDYFDAVSIHPYTFIQQPPPEHDLDWVIYHYANMVDTVAELRVILDDMGCPDMPVQFTEMGWPSLLINDDRQAAYLSRSLLFAMSLEIDFYDWYTFWDGSGSASLPTEDYFGLFTYPGNTEETEPKPSYLALTGANEKIGDARFAGDLGAKLGWNDGNYAFVFANDTDLWTIALWHDGSNIFDETQVSVPLPINAEGSWTLYDQDGVELSTGPVANGDVTVTISGEVSYLQFGVAPPDTQSF